MTDSTARPVEPDELDGPVASAAHHRVIFENDRVRVLETSIPRGDTTALHTHRRPTAMHVVSGDHFVRRDGEGIVEIDTRHQEPPYEMPPILWSEDNPPHTIENVGQVDLVLIGVEIKC